MKTRPKLKTKPFTVKLIGRPLNGREVASKYGLTSAEFLRVYKRAARGSSSITAEKASKGAALGLKLKTAR